MPCEYIKVVEEAYSGMHRKRYPRLPRPKFKKLPFDREIQDTFEWEGETYDVYNHFKHGRVVIDRKDFFLYENWCQVAPNMLQRAMMRLPVEPLI